MRRQSLAKIINDVPRAIKSDRNLPPSCHSQSDALNVLASCLQQVKVLEEPQVSDPVRTCRSSGNTASESSQNAASQSPVTTNLPQIIKASDERILRWKWPSKCGIHPSQRAQSSSSGSQSGSASSSVSASVLGHRLTSSATTRIGPEG